MAKKREKKMTIAFWMKQYKTNPTVIEAVKAKNKMQPNSRITESEYISMIEKWLGEPVRGHK